MLRYGVNYNCNFIEADDTQLYVECPPNDHTDASRQITECVEDLRRWLTDNRLLLNEDEAEAILFRSSCPVISTINIGGSVAQLKTTVRDIGVVLAGLEIRGILVANATMFSHLLPGF